MCFKGSSDSFDVLPVSLSFAFGAVFVSAGLAQTSFQQVLAQTPFQQYFELRPF